MSAFPATVAIAARNAAPTIARAIRSALDTHPAALLLVDDHSTDDTARIAQDAACGRLRVIRPDEHHGLGHARATALAHVDTPYLVWLDADDALEPTRVERLVSLMDRENADVAADAVDLYRGDTGAFLRNVPMSGFLFNGLPGLPRLFERNYLPGLAQVAVRTAFARQIGGYDSTLRASEDLDFALRAVVSGARFALSRDVGYRMYDYAGSLSRDLSAQLEANRTVLLRHSYDTARAAYLKSGYAPRLAHWGLVSMAFFRKEYDAALRFLDHASPRDADPAEILEPDGPWPFPEGWRRAFARGTALLLLGDAPQALPELERASTLRDTAESLNNLAVAAARLGQASRAHDLWTQALTRFPGYRDALLNRDAPTPAHITTHPLRVHASRSDYRPTTPGTPGPATSPST